MTNIDILNTVLLLLAIGYGVSFGVGNVIKKTIGAITLRPIKQNNTGKILDGLFVTAILYFAFTQKAWLIGIMG